MTSLKEMYDHHPDLKTCVFPQALGWSTWWSSFGMFDLAVFAFFFQTIVFVPFLHYSIFNCFILYTHLESGCSRAAYEITNIIMWGILKAGANMVCISEIYEEMCDSPIQCPAFLGLILSAIKCKVCCHCIKKPTPSK